MKKYLNMCSLQFLNVTRVLVAGMLIASWNLQKVSAEELQVEKAKMESLVVGGGCFWCLDAVFRAFKGVADVESGYAGGHVANPTYEQVGVGTTGHAEVVRIDFDPQVINEVQLLTIFFHAHDPTTKDRQGNDVGPQYRSIILFKSEQQKKNAAAVMREITDKKLWGDKPLVTEVEPLQNFYPAEKYHQNYYAQNSNQPYCAIVIGPKLKKVKEQFSTLLR
jgi:peptide-methionine (S)-S-oxide reductase